MQDKALKALPQKTCMDWSLGDYVYLWVIASRAKKQSHQHTELNTPAFKPEMKGRQSKAFTNNPPSFRPGLNQKALGKAWDSLFIKNS